MSRVLVHCRHRSAQDVAVAPMESDDEAEESDGSSDSEDAPVRPPTGRPMLIRELD
jgi:hypothetical protein